MNYRFINAIADVAPQSWNALNHQGDPFLSHAFLHALESSGSACPKTGWQPQHLLIENNGALIAALPLYIKEHSYGEYVFDWSWADAYHRHGVDYYPKLLSAIPFTPATGSRLICAELSSEILSAVKQALANKLDEINGSSWHILFVPNNQLGDLKALGGDVRLGCQYHWHNKHYKSFDDFLAGFSSRKRKNLKKERATVAKQNITLKRLTGAQITAQHWQYFFHCYQTTYAKWSGHGGYLTPEFFKAMQAMQDKILLVMAYQTDAQGEERAIACALNFYNEDTLYGRYWGALADADCLHFEACYYQGIEFCIERGLKRFDPGAQGEHKIQRGFEPTLTYSLHHMVAPEFRSAIQHFLQEESGAIIDYQKRASQQLPFKKEPHN